MDETQHVSQANLTFTAENAETHHGDAIHQWALRQKIKADQFEQDDREEYMMAVIKVAQKTRVLEDKARVDAQINEHKEQRAREVEEARRKLAQMAKEDGFSVADLNSDEDIDGLDDDEQERLEKARDKFKDYFDS